MDVTVNSPSVNNIGVSDSTSDVSSSDNLDLWTIERILNWSKSYLEEKCNDSNLQNARLDVELLLSNVLSVERIQLYLDLKKPLSKDERDRFKILLRRRILGEPIAYILGYKDFYRSRFKVDKSVLIPRPETEQIIDVALSLLSPDDVEKSILDIGTGSGCICLSIAKERPNLQYQAIDISQDAISVAVQNSELLGLTNVSFQESDFFEFMKIDQRKWDLIVSNPPYIPLSDSLLLSPSVKDFEPSMALFDVHPQNGLADGLTFYRYIAQFAIGALHPGGTVVIECGQGQSTIIMDIFKSAGLREVKVFKDLANIERIISAML
jgi:release factor glutamine methyltransferase